MVLLTLVVLIRQAGDVPCGKELRSGTVVVVDIVAPVQVEATDDPVERAARVGGDPQLFDERVLVTVGIEPEGDRTGERTGQVDEELLIELGERR